MNIGLLIEFYPFVHIGEITCLNLKLNIIDIVTFGFRGNNPDIKFTNAGWGAKPPLYINDFKTNLKVTSH